MPRVEATRRLLLRVVTSLLMFMIGPAIAWEVGSLEGLAIYSITHVFARLLSAELGAVSRTNALFLFRFAPAFLVFAGVFSGVNDLPNWIYLVAIPFLLGYYEGGYWVSFHSFFNKGGKANSSFQRREVVASCVSAGGVVVLDWMHAVHVAGLLGACLAMLAIALPLNSEEAPELTRLELNESAVAFGRIGTSSFGVATAWGRFAMRLLTLSQGGIAFLGIMVAAAEVVGWQARSFIKSKQGEGTPLVIDGVEIQTEALESWRQGVKTSFVGLTLLGLGFFLSPWIGYFGFLVFVGGTRGILRLSELNLIKPMFVGGRHIGARERSKFRAQARSVIIFGALIGASLWFGIIDANNDMENIGVLAVLVSLLAVVGMRWAEFRISLRAENE